MPHKWIYITDPREYGKVFVNGMWYHCVECKEWANGSNNATPDAKCRMPWDLQPDLYSDDPWDYDAKFSCEDIQVMRIQGE